MAETLSAMPISEDAARELSRAAKQAQTWLTRRDRLIVRAIADGGGLREVARLVGLTHPAVAKIVARNASDCYVVGHGWDAPDGPGLPTCRRCGIEFPGKGATEDA